MITTAVTLSADDGETLEARWDRPSDPPGDVVVLCHPHPLQGGTMRAPLMDHLTNGLVGRGFSVLRFNFRGVGESSGTHDFGESELRDISAAWAEASGKKAPSLHLAGWSFGAATSLAWMAATETAVGWVGVAPPVKGEHSPALPSQLPASPRTFILGDRDQFTTVEEIESYASQVSGDVRIVKGSDHFFYFREQVVADLMADAFEAEQFPI